MPNAKCSRGRSRNCTSSLTASRRIGDQATVGFWLEKAEAERGERWSMEAEIGDAAGAIWQYLDEHGVTTLSKLRQGTKLPDQLLLLGVGWLAREGKLRLVREGRTVRVDLRERGPA
ncbi:MAG: hypothetical protein DMD96_00310 [Candidatus Rokuibacteriota bacterium]|nr:MAG: hypothetical protein DMD96_00310 [Candidatus Rokubacteria bacterium]